MKYLYVLLLLAFTACNSGRRISNGTARKIFNDSTARVMSLEEPTNRELVYYITPAGKKILLKRISGQAELAPASHPAILRDTVEESGPVRDSRVGANDPFTGSVRKTPKTTYSDKAYKSYRTIPALFRKLESNDFMRGLAIGHKDERVEQEDRNVIIEKAYLYTITVEGDNDLHLLIGNTPVYKKGVTRVFNAEISGVPRDGTAEEKKHFKELREKMIREMSDIPLCGRNEYLQSHRRISIRGSLFFDSHHATKPARCQEVEGESAWEIHPVWDISF